MDSRQRLGILQWALEQTSIAGKMDAMHGGVLRHAVAECLEIIGEGREAVRASTCVFMKLQARVPLLHWHVSSQIAKSWLRRPATEILVSWNITAKAQRMCAVFR